MRTFYVLEDPANVYREPTTVYRRVRKCDGSHVMIDYLLFSNGEADPRYRDGKRLEDRDLPGMMVRWSMDGCRLTYVEPRG